MVDLKKIKTLLEDNFRVDGTYRIDPVTGVVDVNGDVQLLRNIDKLPVQFGRVSGYFICRRKSLVTLKGAPHYVGEDFDCDHNKLNSLEFAPTHVRGDFSCNYNYLIDLTHAPVKVGGGYYCTFNKLTSLSGAPRKVSGSFWCFNNPLTNLSGAPDYIGRTFCLDYSAQLPLLKMCTYQDARIENCPDVVQSILSKYKARGKPGALLAAAELIRAGYRENARW